MIMQPKNHFERWKDTVKELKAQRIKDRAKSIEIGRKRNWSRTLKINRQAEANPFIDRPEYTFQLKNRVL